MHPTLVVPIVILVVAALAAAFIRSPKTVSVPVHEVQEAVA